MSPRPHDLEHKSWWDVFLHYGGGLALGAAAVYGIGYGVGKLSEAMIQRVIDFFSERREVIERQIQDLKDEARQLARETRPGYANLDLREVETRIANLELELYEIERAMREAEREPTEKSAPPPGAHGVYR